jgi:serine/threonine protein kinase
VYKGRDYRTSEIVAMKIIALDDEETLEDVRKEIQILAACDHENIVKYYGSYFKDENLWYVLFVLSLHQFSSHACLSRWPTGL